MANMKTLQAAIGDQWCAIMEPHGFTHVKPLHFVRRCGTVFHIVSPAINRSGTLRVFAFAWVPQVQDPIQTRLTELVKHASVTTGGALAPDGMDSGTWSWEIDTPEAIEAFVEQLQDIITDQVLPWFAATADRASFWAHLLPEYQEKPEIQARREQVQNPPSDTPDFGLPDQSALLTKVEPLQGDAWVAELETRLAPLGFSSKPGDGPRFLREHAGFIHVLQPVLVNNGVNLVLHAYVWMPALQGLEDDEPLPDELLMVNGGNVGPLGLEPRSHVWSVFTPDHWSQTLGHLPSCLELMVEPWFQGITDLNVFIQELHPALKGTYIERGLQELAGTTQTTSPSASQTLPGFAADHVVFLKKGSLLPPQQWQGAIAACGFNLVIDTDFDPETFVGRLPCHYEGNPCGFDFCYEPLDPDMMEDGDAEMIGDRNMLVSLTAVRGTSDDLAALLAAAVLCAVADGILLECGEPPAIDRTQAVMWAKQKEMAPHA